MADADTVGRQFLDYYYGIFSTNRPGLATLYQDASMLTFEGQKLQGTQAIVGKLTSLPFQKAAIQRTSEDFQPSVSGGIMVFVCGNILPEGENNPLKFSQVFHLMPFNNSFVVTNDMFRLNLG